METAFPKLVTLLESDESKLGAENEGRGVDPCMGELESAL
jgi:hypothetical protein